MNSEDYYSGHWSLWLKVFLSPCVILILTRTSDHRSKCLCFQAEIVLHNFLGLSWTQSDEGKKSKFNLQNTADAIFFLNYKFKCIFPSSICLPWSVRIVSLVSWKEERELVCVFHSGLVIWLEHHVITFFSLSLASSKHLERFSLRIQSPTTLLSPTWWDDGSVKPNH